MYKITVITLISLLAISACKDKSAETTNSLATTSVSLSRVLSVAPPVNVQTPQSFKTTTTAGKLVSQSADNGDGCVIVNNSDLNDPTSNYSKCKAIDQVKQRFFAVGPTVIQNVLTNLDNSISNMFGEGTKYLPCLDRENIDGGSMGVEGSMEDYVAFSESQYSLSKTFADGSSFDTGVTYYLSCIRSTDDSSGAWSGIGQKDGITYLSAGGTAINGLAIIDEDTNIDYWYSVNGLLSTFDPADPAEKQGPSASTYGDVLTYQGSTALVHVRSNAGTNTVELSMTGSGVGDGCGARLITDGNYLFYEANRNYYARCSTTDTTAIIYDDTAITDRPYDAVFDNLEYCFDVSGSTPISVADANCEDRGLTGEDFNVAMLTRADIKAYNAPYLFMAEPTDVPPFKAIERPQVFVVDEEDLQTYDEDSFYFPNISHLNTRTAGFCKDEATVTPANIETIFELDFSTISADKITAINEAFAVRVYAQVDNGLKVKNDYRYWSDFTATAILTNNDVEISTTLTLMTNTDGGVQNIAYVIEGITFEATDKLKLELAGTTKYQCSADAPNLGSAATGVGMGRVRFAYYFPPIESMVAN